MKSIDYKFLCIIFLLLAAVREDFKSYKIPNYLIALGLMASLVLYIAGHGWGSILSWFSGIFFPFALLFPLFFIRAVGAGDIKLFSVIGGFYGAAFGIQTIILSFLAAAIFSVILIIRKKQFQKRILTLKLYMHKLYVAKAMKEKKPHWYHYYDSNTDKREGAIHFSASILIGFVAAKLLTVYCPGFSFLFLFL
ncbi:A24 family peptidase [Anaerocolumna xylanovorans]|uniref:Type IV leader peptidase family protein n=1 Tax=Anaerocolumna xylanovorans DSM 12503 TaxID=1121345 RepID=A0A1M7YMK3_9FIRM|nr:prepilin peptidase [Anaerocolumna xylanovorans]SHO53869.1 Type IV leader peptidase family protein [Anaerocolumna xylanovorans DSM 12503]